MMRWRQWPRGGGLKLALGLSLGVNLLVLGAIGGVALNRGDAGRGVPGLRDPGLFGYVAMLPHAERDALRADLRRGGAQEGRGRVREAHARLAAEIASPDVSAEGLRAAFDGLGTARKQAGQALESALITRILALSPEARADYAARVLRSGRGRPGDGSGGPKGGKEKRD